MRSAEPRSPLGENCIRWGTQLPASVSKMQTPGESEEEKNQAENRGPGEGEVSASSGGKQGR